MDGPQDTQGQITEGNFAERISNLTYDFPSTVYPCTNLILTISLPSHPPRHRQYTHSPTHLLTLPPAHPYTHPPMHLFKCITIHPHLIYACMHTSNHPSIHIPTHPTILPPIRPYAHLCIHSYIDTHTFIQSRTRIPSNNTSHPHAHLPSQPFMRPPTHLTAIRVPTLPSTQLSVHMPRLACIIYTPIPTPFHPYTHPPICSPWILTSIHQYIHPPTYMPSITHPSPAHSP